MPNLVLFFFTHICRYQTRVLRSTSILLYRTESQKHSSYCTAGCCKDLPAQASFSEYCLPLSWNPSMSKAITFLHESMLLKMSLQRLSRAARVTREVSTADKHS